MNRLLTIGRSTGLFRQCPQNLPMFHSRGIRRTFVKVNVENQNSDQEQHERTSYKPNFVLQFDKDGRLVIYRAKMRGPYIQAGIIHLVLAYTAYQIIVKWYSNSKFKNILCIFGFVVSFVLCFMSFRAGRSFLTELSLKSDGRHIVYRSFYWPLLREVPLSSIEPLGDVEFNFMKMQDVAFLELPDKGFTLNLDPNTTPYIFDNDLMDAILKGRDIKIDDISNQTMIDL